MPWSIDARVPIRFGVISDAAPDDAILLEEGAASPLPGTTVVRFAVEMPDHGAGCACCLPRSPAAQALASLFQARAKGDVAFFRQVLAVTHSAEGDAALWAALRTDPVVSSRFRLDGHAVTG